MNWRRIRSTVTTSRLRLPLVWYRHQGMRPSDAFLASYPRSGNTWLRFVLGEVLTGQPIDFDNMDNFIPYVKFYRDATPILESNGRLIKTHEPYYSVYKKAIYVVRDPRNCALSAHARLGELKIVGPSLDTFIPWFLRGGPYGHGSWAAHIRSWMDGPLPKQGKLLVVKFEDLRKSPEEWVSKMVGFLGFPVDMEKIRLAVANNSIERMQVKERQSKTLFQGESEEGRFVRKGSTSGWREKMTPAHLRLFEQYAGKEMARLGYTISDSDLRPKEPEAAAR